MSILFFATATLSQDVRSYGGYVRRNQSFASPIGNYTYEMVSSPSFGSGVN